MEDWLHQKVSCWPWQEIFHSFPSGRCLMGHLQYQEQASLKMQHTARLLSGIGRVASELPPTAVLMRAGGPTGPRQASLDPQPRLLHRALFLVEEGGALERPPVRDAAKSLACASHYLGLRGAFATLARQDWAAVAEWLVSARIFLLYIGYIAGMFAVWGPYVSLLRATRRPALQLERPMLALTSIWWQPSPPLSLPPHFHQQGLP